MGNLRSSAWAEGELIGTAVKVGTAVAGTALFAWVVWNIVNFCTREQQPGSDSSRDVVPGTTAGELGDGIFGGGGAGDAGLIVYEDRYHQIERNDQNSASRTITFMTYNVWKQEGTNLHERIKSIGRLVKQHSPDVIFFQEVTPNIYGMFQTFSWWDDYDHSDSSERVTEGDFCIVLSKFRIEPESYISSVGRKVFVYKLVVGFGKRLFVANGHLKCPNPPQMHSETRKKQANAAMNILNFYASNVVFGGDMNWDEVVDGRFPLHEGWVDAWTDLKPNNNGWTYDTKSNRLLKHRKPLQKRLDRFVCKLRDFRLIDIKLIGMEANPPSDHYGLLLTICDK